MLTFHSNQSRQDCEGTSRRDFLRVGAMGLAGLSLADLFAIKAQAAAQGKHLKNKSIVFLFLRGGATQTETWDPKMSAPDKIRSMMGEVKTKIPGVTFGGTFPKLGERADRMAVVRSFKVGTGSHGAGRSLITTGDNALKAPFGSVYGRVAGSTNPRNGMPNNVVLTPAAAAPEFNQLRSQATELLQTGSLPREYKAFDPGSGKGASVGKKGKKGKAPKADGLLADMQLQLSEKRLEDRRSLLKQLDEVKRGLDAGGAEEMSKYRQQAYDVLMGGVTDAFDLSKEDPKQIEKYDTKDFRVNPKALKKGTKNAKKIPMFEPLALGKQMLLARRLCEAGAGFVTVVSEGWDMHGNAFGVNDGMPCLGRAVDHAVSTFLDDLAQRGMSDDVLLVISGEMGRTPKINNKGGRDHWGNLCSLAFAGGGLKLGQAVGASDKNAGTPATNPYNVSHLSATLLQSLFDVTQLRLMSAVPTEIIRAASADPIHELIG